MATHLFTFALNENWLMTSIAYFILRIIVGLFSLLPMSWLHVLSNFISFLLQHIFRYRKSVVQTNLKNAFPNKSGSELKSIEKVFYKNLSDIILEGIKGLTLSRPELEKRFQYLNIDLVNEEFEKGKSVIIIASHIANWEWGVLSFDFWTKGQVVGIYKPLKNQLIDNYYNDQRKQWGLQLTSMAQTGRSIIERKNESTVFVFIADQTPSDVHNAQWFNFLNQDTPFLHGVDKIARKTNYPVFNTDIQRVGRGQYEVTFEKLSDEPRDLKPGALTERYAKALEKIIQQRPGNWLWSHKRWKRKRPKK